MMKNIITEGLFQDIEDTKLRYLLTLSIESEQMPSWDDSLSLLLDEIDKSIFA